MTDERVDSICKQIVAIRNTEAVQNLVMDVWVVRENEGTDAAVKFAKVLLICVKQFKEYEDYTCRKNLLSKPEDCDG